MMQTLAPLSDVVRRVKGKRKTTADQGPSGYYKGADKTSMGWGYMLS